MSEQRPLGQTPSQTIGPFFGYALPYPGGPEVAAPWQPNAIRLHGTVFDGAGEPVPDAIIEIWHADADGGVIAALGSLDRDGYTVTGFGRAAVNRAGEYTFSTIKPGPMRPEAAPYILVTIFARGLTHHLFTRCYFDDEETRNAGDALLAGLPDDRRATLVGVLDAPQSYRFDIRLQGEGETVFLDFDAADPVRL
ncbi:protocatechuate 3,4-dioxygenase subunit alpha [Cryobacterium sp. AP23]